MNDDPPPRKKKVKNIEYGTYIERALDKIKDDPRAQSLDAPRQLRMVAQP